MKAFIIASVLCTIAMARPDGLHHGRESENKLHVEGHQTNSVQDQHESHKFGDKLVHHKASASYAPAMSYAHPASSQAEEIQHHSPKYVAPSAQSSQYFIHSTVPAQSHYTTTVHSKYQAPVQSHYQAPAQHFQAPVQSHYQAPAQSHYQAPAQSQFQAPAKYHYQTLVPSHFQAPVEAQYEAPAHFHHQRPAQSHYHQQIESQEGIVESIVSSSHFNPAYNSDESVHKHISVHVPQHQQQQIYLPMIHYQPAQKQKHYKIIFVKAPSAQQKAPVIVAPNVQHEEKTIIYVLHKTPEQVPDIVLPEPKPTKVNKPEVYYINYETAKKDKQHQIDTNEVDAIAPVAQHLHQEQVHHHQQPEQVHPQEQQQQQHNVVETITTELPRYTPEEHVTIEPTAAQHGLPEPTPTYQISHEIVHIPAKQQQASFSVNQNPEAPCTDESHAKY